LQFVHRLHCNLSTGPTIAFDYVLFRVQTRKETLILRDISRYTINIVAMKRPRRSREPGSTNEDTPEDTSATVEAQANATGPAHSGSSSPKRTQNYTTATRPVTAHTQTPPGLPLQQGCYVGIPVFCGIPAVSLPTDGRALFQVALRFVESDDYYSLIQLARVGLNESFDERRRCGFTCNLKPGVNPNFACAPTPAGHYWLDVRSANLLHYATFIGAFRAALALLIICPTQLSTHCLVTICSNTDPAGTVVKWGVAELTRFLCNLYSLEATAASCNGRVTAICKMFSNALCVYEVGEARPASLPFLALPRMSDRIEAAGAEPAPVLAAFCAAAGINTSGAFGTIPGVS
jgi:hypothetical protein